MIEIDNEITIGLFGTCGNSNWRDKFIKEYDKLNINYYNPQVENWNPKLAVVEAEHLAKDQIILFPITYETYGTGSLSELGFSILNAIKLDNKRNFVVMIDDYLDDSLQNKELISESLRSRKLVKQHLLKLNLSNIYLVNTLDEMLQVSIILYNIEKLKLPINKYNLTNYKGGDTK